MPGSFKKQSFQYSKRRPRVRISMTPFLPLRNCSSYLEDGKVSESMTFTRQLFRYLPNAAPETSQRCTCISIEKVPKLSPARALNSSVGDQ